MSPRQEKALRREKKLIARTNLAWHYAPDKLEKWLEDMERKGNNLYRVSQSGTRFYFLKGAPRRVKITFDQHMGGDGGYYAFHAECGWRLVFTAGYPATTLWFREYGAGENPPAFYSDGPSALEHAKKYTRRIMLFFIPVIILWLIGLTFHLWVWAEDGMGRFDVFWIVLSICTVLLYGWMAVRTLCYYRRVKRKIQGPDES